MIEMRWFQRSSWGLGEEGPERVLQYREGSYQRRQVGTATDGVQMVESEASWDGTDWQDVPTVFA